MGKVQEDREGMVWNGTNERLGENMNTIKENRSSARGYQGSWSRSKHRGN
jgi:hypothetical protein